MFSLPFSVRRELPIFNPDFSVRRKKNPSRNPKMDIFKMSIFRFLDGIFFRRTEKSGTKIWVLRRTENGKENIYKNQCFF